MQAQLRIVALESILPGLPGHPVPRSHIDLVIKYSDSILILESQVLQAKVTTPLAIIKAVMPFAGPWDGNNTTTRNSWTSNVLSTAPPILYSMQTVMRQFRTADLHR
jgi:hypothetical protein